MLEEPFHLAGVGIQRQGGIGIVGVADARAAQVAPPWFGLGGAPIGGVEFGIVSTSYPGLRALAHIVGQSAPAVAAGIALQRHGDELPDPLAGLGIIGADITMVVVLGPVA